MKVPTTIVYRDDMFTLENENWISTITAHFGQWYLEKGKIAVGKEQTQAKMIKQFLTTSCKWLQLELERLSAQVFWSTSISS